MRIHFLILFILVCFTATTVWYRSGAHECPAPLSYRIGVIDPAFDLSFDEVRAYTEQSIAVWESETSRNLFEYTDASEAGVVVNFVFDERQAFADAAETDRTELDDKFAESQEITDAVDDLQADYERLSTNYEAQAAAYEASLAEHNATVQRYNDRGGAPEDVFAELQAESQTLQAEADDLNRTRTELNQLAADINRLGERGNRLIRDYNEEVEDFNAEYGHEREFTQGDYRAGVINIYKFSSDAELVRVLAHEFGHALGLPHVDGASSVMHYLLEDSDEMPVLAAEDRISLNEVCGSTESFSQQIRRHIRSALEWF